MADAAASGVNEVEAALHDAHLTSPAEGIVSEIYPTDGELVGVGTPLLSIVELNEPYAVFNVREDMMPHFWLGRIISTVCLIVRMRRCNKRDVPS